MNKSVITVQNLTKKFQDFLAVDHISFSIMEGEIVGLLGPNGAGKTTTIQMLLSLMTPTEGEIFYFGKPFLENREKILKTINYSFGYSQLPWRMTALENLKVFGWLYEVKNFKRKIYELAERFQATHLLEKKTQDLSSGELTRIFLIKAFINDPKILLLDEPTAALDPDIAEKIRTFILEERERHALTLLVTSHNMAEMEEMCDRVIFLHRGKILEINTPQELARRREESELHLMVREGKGELLRLISEHGFRSIEKKNFTVIFMPEASIASFLSKIGKAQVSYSEIEVVHPSLEDYFISVTKRGI